MRPPRSLLLTAALLMSPTAWTAELGPVETFHGACEPSGAMPLKDGAMDSGFIVANDEDNILRIYLPGETQPTAVPSANVNGALGLDETDEDQKVDFEAAARVGDRTFLIGSHSRSGKGNRRPSRETFVSIVVAGQPEALQVSVSKPATLLEAIVGIEETEETKEAIDALKKSIAIDNKKHPDLAAEVDGLNIEGLAQGPDGKSMLIGMRNPLTKQGAAIVIPFHNPQDAIDKQKTPDLGPPMVLDLGGRGIRSMEYSPATKSYLISAGPHQKTGNFALFTWSGVASQKPVPMDAANTLLSALDRFQTEAMFVDAAGNKVRLFSDDGDLPDASGTICQDLTDKTKQQFRSVVLTLP